MRFGVTGGRFYDDANQIELQLMCMPGDAVLVHGAASGADTLCAHTWADWGGTTEPHPADWTTHGKAAGPLRNQEMVDSGLDLLIAFPGGRGTADMTRRAEKAGVPVRRVTE
jgi:hypothetical protein